jgi:hypothetical protein
VRAFGTAGEMKSESRPSARDEATAYQARLRHSDVLMPAISRGREDWRISRRGELADVPTGIGSTGSCGAATSLWASMRTRLCASVWVQGMCATYERAA